MKFSNKTGQYIMYGLLFIVAVYIFCLCFHFQETTVKALNGSLQEYIKNNKYGSPIEGFSNSTFYNKNSGNFEKKDNTFEAIENKLRSLTEELGGKNGKKEIKELLTNTKKIMKMECAKCMMNMVNNNKTSTSIEIENMIDEDNEDNCNKCRRYTELVDTIESVLQDL